MKKILLLAVAALASLGAFAQDYTHSAGLVVGNLNGLSYKYFISDELAIQADLEVLVLFQLQVVMQALMRFLTQKMVIQAFLRKKVL